MKPRIHLIAPAGSCRPFYPALGVENGTDLLRLVQEIIGDGYLVTGDATQMDVVEDELRGGRTDDQARVTDIERALGDDEVVAMVTVRGGAWFTRILPALDLSVLDRRTRPVAVFGFSELTPLVNLVADHPRGRGVYDMGPAFLTYGLKRHAAVALGDDLPEKETPGAWMRARLRPEFSAFFQRVRGMVEGRWSPDPMTARLAGGTLPDRFDATIVGGNLTVLSTLIGSPFQSCVDPRGRWALIEDFNDKPERIDRFLAHLTLAGFWKECAGLLLGDFHQGELDLIDAVLAMLAFHLPPERRIPILVTREVGHIWPMTPLPLNVPLNVQRSGADEYALSIPMSSLRTV